jgi:hypothetical protein
MRVIAIQLRTPYKNSGKRSSRYDHAIDAKVLQVNRRKSPSGDWLRVFFPEDGKSGDLGVGLELPAESAVALAHLLLAVAQGGAPEVFVRFESAK